MAIGRKIYVVGDKVGYANWMEGELVKQMNKANLVVFTGGTDISPTIYGKKANSRTEHPDVPRDTHEKEMFELAIAMRIPMVGICRGAQFLCAMAGGILVQHQQHPAFHDIQTPDGRLIRVTSDHHQRAYPHVLDQQDYRLLAWANALSPYNQGEHANDILPIPESREAENVFYTRIRALGIQSHPEWIYPASNELERQSLQYHRGLLTMLCEDKL